MARLNAMGELAGALAHELNQPLSAVANYLAAARRVLESEGNDEARDLLAKASDQAARAAQIVARVRSAVERGRIETAEESVAALAREATEIAIDGLGGASKGVSVRYQFDGSADRVSADRLQAQQVVLNLVRNAVEAMAGSPRRELRVGSRDGEPGFVEVYVADTGPGVSPDMAQSLFQPFVSGKADGMGVGLAISHNIVEAHGGRIWAGPNDDGGATFYFSLPRAPGVRADSRNRTVR